MLYDYLPILILSAIAIAFAGGNIIFSFLIGPRIEKEEKLDVYECGMPPIGSAREPFNIKFFLVAVLFVIFDIEIAYLFLWGVVFKSLGWYGLMAMGLFLGLLVFTLVYELKKGVLNWASKPNSLISSAATSSQQPLKKS